jgi:hypothetical protein
MSNYQSLRRYEQCHVTEYRTVLHSICSSETPSHLLPHLTNTTPSQLFPDTELCMQNFGGYYEE